MKWNSRYLVYCVSQGEPDPEKMLELDRERWPGGVMCGYMLWIRDVLGWLRQIIPEAWLDRYTLYDHAAFDRWLAELFPEVDYR